jgi:hypothetical protein
MLTLQPTISTPNNIMMLPEQPQQQQQQQLDPTLLTAL